MRLSLLIAFLGWSLTAYSQLHQETTSKHAVWKALPSAFYTPETTIGVGVLLLVERESKHSDLSNSNAQFYLDVTFRKQIQLQNDHNIYGKFLKQNIYLMGSNDLSRFPEFYFGIGNETQVNDACLIDFNLVNFKNFAYVEVQPKSYIGLVVHHQALTDLNKFIKTPSFTFTNKGYASSGLGFSFLKDERDNIFNPCKGYFIQGGIVRYGDHRNQTGSFTNTWLDARLYKTFANDLVLNANVCLFNNVGVVPFRMMPKLGGPRFLRGYYMGRFRDNNASIIRAELRKMIFSRIGVAAFGDVGKVYQSVSTFNNSGWNCTYGVGLRIKHDLKSNANIRIDYGRSYDSHGLYIVFAEAF
ncbi:MAG: hypothetical protein ACI8ZN_001618 [Bacteroidia bacterium]